MKKIFLKLIYCFYFFIQTITIFSQNYHQSSNFCKVDSVNNLSSSNSLGKSVFSGYGGVFTPIGDLKILVVFVDFGASYNNYQVDDWPNGANTFPNWATQNGGKEIFYSNNSDFTTYANSSISKRNISRFYHEMSKGQFKLTADYFPTRISINLNSVNSFDEANRAAMQQLMPLVNWNNYDKRTNSPSYTFDNSTSSPDMKPDYVVFVYRYQGGKPQWETTKIRTPNPWQYSAEGGGGVSELKNSGGISANGYTSSTDGFTYVNGGYNMPHQLFIHEIAHELYDCPHFSYANSAVGFNLYGQPGGWGSMNILSGAVGTMLGWERWYLNWIQLTCNGVNSDIQNETNLPANGEFIIRDFVITGDVIRIKIPNGLVNGTNNNQYLWIENHQGNSIFDSRGFGIGPLGCDNPPNYMNSSSTGIFAYIEGIEDNRSIVPNIVGRKANRINFLNGFGNYDFNFDLSDYTTDCKLWGSKIYNFNISKENPLSGQNKSQNIRRDGLDNFPNEITLVSDYNGGPNEGSNINKLNGVYSYDVFSSDAKLFQNNNKIGINSNPTIINFPLFYGGSQRPTPYYINGISVELITQFSDGSQKIKVRYNDITINKNINWAGTDIVVNNITNNSNPDVIVAPYTTLTIDKSNSVSRTIPEPSTGEFLNTTIVSLENASSFVQDVNSEVIVKNQSTLFLKQGSTYTINDNSVLRIKAGSNLIIKSGATLIINNSGRIEIEAGAYICIENGATINLVNVLSRINLRNGYQIGFNPIIPTARISPNSSNLTVCNNNPSAFVNSGLGKINTFIQNTFIQNETVNISSIKSGYNIYAGTYVTNQKPNGSVSITSGTTTLFDSENDIELSQEFTVNENSYFEIRNKAN